MERPLNQSSMIPIKYSDSKSMMNNKIGPNSNYPPQGSNYYSNPVTNLNSFNSYQNPNGTLSNQHGGGVNSNNSNIYSNNQPPSQHHHHPHQQQQQQTSPIQQGQIPQRSNTASSNMSNPLPRSSSSAPYYTTAGPVYTSAPNASTGCLLS